VSDTHGFYSRPGHFYGKLSLIRITPQNVRTACRYFRYDAGHISGASTPSTHLEGEFVTRSPFAAATAAAIAIAAGGGRSPADPAPPLVNAACAATVYDATVSGDDNPPRPGSETLITARWRNVNVSPH
jgi:hypothetical protein